MTAANPRPGLFRPDLKRRGIGVVMAVLLAFVLYAGVREAGKSGPGVPRQSTVQTLSSGRDHPDHRPAQTAAEERFSQALWNIHAEVRTAAVRMTFAGLAYKLGDADAGSVPTKVAPLAQTFHQAAADLNRLDGPESMLAVRGRYAVALRLFTDAARTMIKVAEDSNDVHLLTAQQMSVQAAGILLEVGDQLWPGEIKPN